jgi:hypothetical protein
MGFLDSLPTAEEAQFGSTVLTADGRKVCLAFAVSGAAQGEGFDPGPPQAPGNADLSSSISDQPTGPLAPGAAFAATITFQNAATPGTGSAPGTNLTVTFDAGLTGITWEREVIRVQPAVVSASSLDGSNGYAQLGAGLFDQAGFSVSGSGDFNGDDIEDAIVGSNGTAYVVFGSSSGFPAGLDLSSLNGTNGFSISGPDPFAGLGASVSSAGDVNKDGVDDLVLGAPQATAGEKENAGQAFVVFGKTTGFSAHLDLTSLDGTNGFSIDGLVADSNLGGSVAGVGDVNNDQIDDLIVSAPNTDRPIPATNPVEYDRSVGEAFVIFGKTSAFEATLNLSTLSGTNGFSLQGDAAGDEFGTSVSGAFDINHDGVKDLIVGARQDGAGGDNSGQAYVVFGRTTAFGPTVPVAGLDGSDGFLIDAPREGHGLGLSVGGAGDLNGDTLDDVMIAEAGTTTEAPRSYVVFGSTSPFSGTFPLSTLDGTNGFAIDAPAANNFNPMAVSRAGDVNGDGIGDAIVGIAETQVNSVAVPGGAYVIFGTDQGFPAALGLADLDGSNGFQFEGIDALELAGRAVGPAGDVNADGLDDVIVGANFGSPGGVTLAGKSYIIFGNGSTTSNGTGTIDETLDLEPGDQVIYRVSATIDAAATVSTTVSAAATPADGIVDSDPNNNSNSQTTTIAASDTTPPTVQDVLIAGTGGSFVWTPLFIDAVDDAGPSGPNNGLGHSVLDGTRTIPWYTVDTFYIRYSEPVNQPTGLSLLGIAVADYAGKYTLSHSGDLTTVVMTSPFGLPETDFGPPTTGIDRLLLGISAGGVTDLAGNPIAAPFQQGIDVLPGDANGNGLASSQDVGLTNFRGFTSFGGPANSRGFQYDPFYDINSSGNVSSADVGLTNFQGFDTLPPDPGPPPQADAPPLFRGGASELEDEDIWANSVDRVFGPEVG